MTPDASSFCLTTLSANRIFQKSCLISGMDNSVRFSSNGQVKITVSENAGLLLDKRTNTYSSRDMKDRGESSFVDEYVMHPSLQEFCLSDSVYQQRYRSWSFASTRSARRPSSVLRRAGNGRKFVSDPCICAWLGLLRTLAISPGAFGFIFLRLLTTSAHRMPERENMMMDGDPSFLIFFGSGGSSISDDQSISAM